MPETPSRTHCKRHPKASVGWKCDACKEELCAACTARLLHQYYCCVCEATATQYRVPRIRRPFVVRVLQSVIYPLSRGLPRLVIAAFVLSALGGLLSYMIDPPESSSSNQATPGLSKAGVAPKGLQALMPYTSAAGSKTLPAGPDSVPDKPPEARPLPPSVKIFTPIRVVLVFLLAFSIVTATAQAGEGLGNHIIMMLKALLGTLVVFLPGAGYLVVVKGGLPDTTMLHEPLPLLYGGLALLYLPGVMAGAATEAGFKEVASPFKVSEWAMRVGWRYLLTVLALAGLTLAAIKLGVAADRVQTAVNVIGVGTVLSEMVALCLLLAMARLIGLLLFVHGRAFDWGKDVDFSDPLLPGVEPTGTRKVVAPAAVARATAAAAAVGPGGEKPESFFVGQVVRALVEKNVVKAAKVYLGRPSWSPGSLNQDQLQQIGVSLARTKNFEAAVRALNDASNAKGPNGARALIALAQAYALNMNDPGKAAETYREVIARFPNTDAAKLAAKKLEPGSSGPVKA